MLLYLIPSRRVVSSLGAASQRSVIIDTVTRLVKIPSFKEQIALFTMIFAVTVWY